MIPCQQYAKYDFGNFVVWFLVRFLVFWSEFSFSQKVFGFGKVEFDQLHLTQCLYLELLTHQDNDDICHSQVEQIEISRGSHGNISRKIYLNILLKISNV